MQLMNDEFLPIVRKGKKEEEEGQMLGFGLVHIVATYFWATHAGDGVYPSWTKCRSLVLVCWKIDKSRKEKKCFSNLVSIVFCSLYPPILLPKSLWFLG